LTKVKYLPIISSICRINRGRILSSKKKKKKKKKTGEESHNPSLFPVFAQEKINKIKH
jgi:hypothetical protein